jgi:hypothetical protein
MSKSHSANGFAAVPPRTVGNEADGVAARLQPSAQERLVALGLAGMARVFDDQQRHPNVTALTFEQRLGLMIAKRPSGRTSGLSCV